MATLESHVNALDDEIGEFTYKLPSTSSSVIERRSVSLPNVGGSSMSPQGVTTLRFVVGHESLFFDPKTMAISVAMRSGSAATPDLKLAQSVAGAFRSLTVCMGGTLTECISDFGRIYHQ